MCKIVQHDEVWVRWAHEFLSLSIQKINVIFLPKHVQYKIIPLQNKNLIKKHGQCFIHLDKLIFMYARCFYVFRERTSYWQ